MQSQQKRIKAPDCLKSPLAEWSDPVEDWRALVTEDILSDTNSRLEGRSLNGQKRRHTMNLTDTISNNLASLNIFSSLTNSEKSKMNTERKIKVSGDFTDRTYLFREPIYLKSGPGHVDFSFVAMEELIEVRKISGLNSRFASSRCSCFSTFFNHKNAFLPPFYLIALIFSFYKLSLLIS